MFFGNERLCRVIRWNNPRNVGSSTCLASWIVRQYSVHCVGKPKSMLVSRLTADDSSVLPTATCCSKSATVSLARLGERVLLFVLRRRFFLIVPISSYLRTTENISCGHRTPHIVLSIASYLLRGLRGSCSPVVTPYHVIYNLEIPRVPHVKVPAFQKGKRTNAVTVGICGGK